MALDPDPATGGLCHEAAHWAACRVAGVHVDEVVLFDRLIETDRGIAAVGMVDHEAADNPAVDGAITCAPFVVNSLFAVGLFAAVSRVLPSSPIISGSEYVFLTTTITDVTVEWLSRAVILDRVVAAILLWLGISMELQPCLVRAIYENWCRSWNQEENGNHGQQRACLPCYSSLDGCGSNLLYCTPSR